MEQRPMGRGQRPTPTDDRISGVLERCPGRYGRLIAGGGLTQSGLNAKTPRMSDIIG
jgi:hypothetical protein